MPLQVLQKNAGNEASVRIRENAKSKEQMVQLIRKGSELIVAASEKVIIIKDTLGQTARRKYQREFASY